MNQNLASIILILLLLSIAFKVVLSYKYFKQSPQNLSKIQQHFIAWSILMFPSKSTFIGDDILFKYLTIIVDIIMKGLFIGFIIVTAKDFPITPRLSIAM